MRRSVMTLSFSLTLRLELVCRYGVRWLPPLQDQLRHFIKNGCALLFALFPRSLTLFAAACLWTDAV